MRLVLLTILVFSLQVFANTNEGSIAGEANMSSVAESDWGRSKDSFVRDNTPHDEIKQLVDNLLTSPENPKIGEKSFRQSDSSH